MFKITLYDYNCSPICTGTVNFFTEDIEDFQKRWFGLLDDDDEERKERFLRSKAGEFVTDYYSDSPELNIVQYDEGEIFTEKTVELEHVTFEAFNIYGWSTKFHVEQWEIYFKWISFKGKYYRIASYKARGVCKYSLFTDRLESVKCYGNPVLESVIVYDPRYSGLQDENEWPDPGFDEFNENKIETICWLTSASFENVQELKNDISMFKITEEIMGQLFENVVGEAG